MRIETAYLLLYLLEHDTLYDNSGYRTIPVEEIKIISEAKELLKEQLSNLAVDLRAGRTSLELNVFRAAKKFIENENKKGKI